MVSILIAVIGGVAVAVRPAAGVTPGFGGTVTYTGKLGPVSATRTICVCAFADAQLTALAG